VRACERGVSEEKLARALNLDVSRIKRRRYLLTGICAEVVSLLQDKQINPHTFDVLRKMKPQRQIEVTELMTSVGNFTNVYAQALQMATRPEDLVQASRPKVKGLTPEQLARLEKEVSSVTKDFKALEETYGDDVLNLVVAAAYVSRLISNAEIERYLALCHPELLAELRVIVGATSLDQPTPIAA
jgi:hypothetical protein